MELMPVNPPRDGRGHTWRPAHCPAEREWRYPHVLVAAKAKRLLSLLQRGTIKLRAVWRVHILPQSLSAGVVRVGKGDFVMTRSDGAHAPVVLRVDKAVQFTGDLDEIETDFPREEPGVSSWVDGVSWGWISPGDSVSLVKNPWRGGRENMRFPKLRKTREKQAFPLVHVPEPVLLDHKCICHIF